MFDFHKSKPEKIILPELLKNNILNFTAPVNINTGEIEENRQTASFNGFKFEITNDIHFDLKGSFHKYHNTGEHNYNDFTAKELLNVLTDLSTKFKINPFSAPLQNLEFGVNVELPFSPEELLKSIISYKGKEYKKREFEGQGNFISFEFNKWYELKIYDKGLQYGLDKHLFRFEFKVKKMEFFRARGINIFTFADLLNTTETKKLINILLKAFKELLIYDNTIQPNKLKQREREIILNGRNPKYWSELKQQGKEIKRERNKFRKLVLKHGKNNIQQTVCDLMKTKLLKLTETDRETEQKISQYLHSFSVKTCPEITDLVYLKTTEQQKPNLSRNNTSNSMLIQDTLTKEERRYCQTCGRNISNQKKGSVFCSEKEFGTEAKKCRNVNSNPRNNYRRKEQRIYGNGFLLFDINLLKQPTAYC